MIHVFKKSQKCIMLQINVNSYYLMILKCRNLDLDRLYSNLIARSQWIGKLFKMLVLVMATILFLAYFLEIIVIRSVIWLRILKGLLHSYTPWRIIQRRVITYIPRLLLWLYYSTIRGSQQSSSKIVTSILTVEKL